MLYLGLVAGVVAGNVAAHAAEIDALSSLCCFADPDSSLPGGCSLSVCGHALEAVPCRPSLIWDRNDGGLSMLGGLPLAIPISVPLLALIGLPFAAFWDVAGFTILTGMVLTRVGCLLNGCCSGRPCEAWFGVNLPDSRGVWKRRIPTQCLEAGWALILLGGFAAAWRFAPFPGAVFLGIMGAYALGRLVLESTRELAVPGQITAGHIISGLMVLCSTAALVVLWPR